MTIISHRYGFVFLKTMKTGSTSVEVDLSQVAGADAVVTPIRPAEPGHAPRNHLHADGTARFTNHMPAAAVRAALGPDRFARYHRFCVLREPVAKCLSHYHMLQRSALHQARGAPIQSWQDYVAAGKFPNDIEIFCERTPKGWVPLVDTFLPYETLARDLAALLARLGLPGFALCARAKAGWSQDPILRAQDVTPAERARIYDVFAHTLAVSGLYGGAGGNG